MANDFKQYKNPPVQEAIFAVYFEKLANAGELRKFLESDFCKTHKPTTNLLQKVQITGKASGKEGFKSTHNFDGFNLHLEGTNKKIIQIRPTHISYHNFDKYDGWDKVFTEFKEIWSEFSKVVLGLDSSRISVRYINLIPIPLELPSGFSEYLKLLPTLPANMPSTLNNFLLQIDAPGPESGMQGLITETLRKAQNTEGMNILLDITVNLYGNYSKDLNEFEASFIKMRKFKNELFENCLTTKTLTQFNS